MYNFQMFVCSNDESSTNSSCHFWNHNVRISQILHHCSVPWQITPLVFFLAQTSYTLDKNSPLEWDFQTFEWLGENSPNSSCHIWNHKSVFLLNFASLLNAMGDKSSVLFYLKLYLIFTKGSHHSAKFQTSDCSGKLWPNFYFDRLLFWKCIKFQLKKVWKSYVSWCQRVIVCTSPLPLSAWELSLQPNFQKGGCLTGPQLLEGECWERGGWLFPRGEGLQFLPKK